MMCITVCHESHKSTWRCCVYLNWYLSSKIGTSRCNRHNKRAQNVFKTIPSPVSPFRQWMWNFTLHCPLTTSATCSSPRVKALGEEEIVDILTLPFCRHSVTASAITYNLAFNWREKEVIWPPKQSAFRTVRTNSTWAFILSITARQKHEEPAFF